MCGLNVTLTASEKSLKEQIIAYIDKVKQDLMVIDSQENKIDILMEYKQCLDLNKSIIMVNERKKRLEEEMKRQQEFVEQRLKQESVATAEALSNFVSPQEIEAPKVIPKEEKKFTMTFIVTGTMEKLKALKEYLKREDLINE